MNDATRMRIPPPKSQKKDWGMIGSRVPQVSWRIGNNESSKPAPGYHTAPCNYQLTRAKDTMHSLRTLPHKADETWLFAACNEASSRAVAEAGIEVSIRYITKWNRMTGG